jgi:ribosomal protein L7/L12
MAANDEDLKRIHDRLRDLESNVRRLLTHLDMEWQEPTPTEGVPDEVLALVRDGNQIEAVKRYREITGCSLGEANDIVGKIVL